MLSEIIRVHGSAQDLRSHISELAAAARSWLAADCEPAGLPVDGDCFASCRMSILQRQEAENRLRRVVERLADYGVSLPHSDIRSFCMAVDAAAI